jgi:hypothetical protein
MPLAELRDMTRHRLHHELIALAGQIDHCKLCVCAQIAADVVAVAAAAEIDPLSLAGLVRGVDDRVRAGE